MTCSGQLGREFMAYARSTYLIIYYIVVVRMKPRSNAGTIVQYTCAQIKCNVYFVYPLQMCCVNGPHREPGAVATISMK